MKPLHACGFVLMAALSFAAPVPAQSLAYVDAGGGALSPPATYGNHLYVGTGATVTTWDMTDPGQPSVVDRSSDAPSRGPIRALATVGDYLYAAWNNPSSEGGITIYSLADPAHPQVVGEVDDYVVSDYKGPSGLAVSGDYVYLGDSQNGLIVLDASDPLAPVNIGTVDGVNEFTAMGIYGGRLLTTGSSWIGGRIVNVVDLTDPAAPVLAGSGVLNGDLVLRAALTDGYAIGVGAELQIYDLHDPTNIIEVYNSTIDVATHAIVEGNALYLIGASGIQVWDFSTPTLPSLLRTVPMDAFAPDQAAHTPFGPLILTHTDRGLLLDVADPLNPGLAAGFTLPVGVDVHAGAFDGTYAYLAETGYGLAVIDPLTLATVGRHDFDLPYALAARDMEDISVDAGRAYLAAWGYGVLIADLSNPAAPTELGRFEFPFASAIEAHGDRVYVSSTTNGGFFKVLDVSNPAQPQELGSLATSQTYDLTVRGDYAYLADGSAFGDGGLRIVDVSNPATPNVVGQDAACTSADGIAVSSDGNTVYLACASDESFQNALRVIDATDKANPVVVGSLSLPGDSQLPDYNVPHSIALSGNTAYVANEFGVDEIDISNPAAPVQIARHEIGYAVRKLELAADGRVFAFAGEAGMFVFAPAPSDAIFADGFD